MKTDKNSGKKMKAHKDQRFNDESRAGKVAKKDKGSKRKLSIYDDFDDEDLNMDSDLDYDSSENPFDY